MKLFHFHLCLIAIVFLFFTPANTYAVDNPFIHMRSKIHAPQTNLFHKIGTSTRSLINSGKIGDTVQKQKAKTRTPALTPTSTPTPVSKIYKVRRINEAVFLKRKDNASELIVQFDNTNAGIHENKQCPNLKIITNMSVLSEPQLQTVNKECLFGSQEYSFQLYTIEKSKKVYVGITIEVTKQGDVFHVIYNPSLWTTNY